MLETYFCYFTESQCKRLKEKLQGKTFLKFDISYYSRGVNCTLIVRSDNTNYNLQELKEMFIYYCISEFADS